jgi:hypothetical protein
VYPGTGGRDVDTEFYMPDDVQCGHFSDDRVKQIITLLYKDRTSPFLPVQPSVVHRDYRRVLAILLFIERGDLIEYFVHAPELNDQKLPFTSKPAFFPDNSQDPFFEDFQKAQWRFCAPKIRDSRRIDWHPDYILPFVRIGEPLGKGHSGKAYKIKIHPAHDRLNPEYTTTQSDGPPNGRVRQQSHALAPKVSWELRQC